MSRVAGAFVENVVQFCEWAEGEEHDLMAGRQHLLVLMAAIPTLEEFRDLDGLEHDSPRRGHAGWQEDHGRFSGLPFQYYRTVFDPHDFEAADEPVTGDLLDDFADIYGELWRGLQVHREGRTSEALFVWVDSYFTHWGNHASSALHAIDEFYRKAIQTSEEP